jgi:hypothetical protein
MPKYKIIDNLTSEEVIIKTNREWIVLKHLTDNYFGGLNKIFQHQVTAFVDYGNNEYKPFKPY